MADPPPKTPRTRAAKTGAGSNDKPETTDTQTKSSSGYSRCLIANLRGCIDWMNVVDDFALAGQKNILPRWGFVMAVLLSLAVTG